MKRYSAMSTVGVTARLVYDGSCVWIPPEMGTPREDQMLGTSGEQLTELAGRVCYDSLGIGRPSFSEPGKSQGYHDHIREVKHGSVQEHFYFTVEVPDPFYTAGFLALVCMNRPGVILQPSRDMSVSRLTVNLRAVVQWQKWSEFFYDATFDNLIETNDHLHAALLKIGHELAPHIVHAPVVTYDDTDLYRLVNPENDHERWVSMYMTCSRGCSHELVRHGDFTAISQRSTRYVNESEGLWVMHPLLDAYLSAEQSDESAESRVKCEQLEFKARELYDTVVTELQPWLAGRGTNPLNARKQARGAARGFLGNALQTELVFSASVAQWKWMLNQRASIHADAEIRDLFCQALGVLKQSDYRDCFKDWDLTASPDGIGQVATLNGEMLG